MNGDGTKKALNAAGIVGLIVGSLTAYNLLTGYVDKRAEKIRQLQDLEERVESLEDMDLQNRLSDTEMMVCDLDPGMRWWRGDCIRKETP